MFEHLEQAGRRFGGSARQNGMLVAALVVGAAMTLGLFWLLGDRLEGVDRILRSQRQAATSRDSAGGGRVAREQSKRTRGSAPEEFGLLVLVESTIYVLVRLRRRRAEAGGASRDDSESPVAARAAAVGFVGLGAVLGYALGNAIPVAIGGVAGAYVLFSVKVADQWERCAVLRFGRFHALRGPGMFRIIPIIDRVAARVDQRVQTTEMYAEAALTSDAVPVHVDAVIFWIVSDVEKAFLELQNFDRIVGLVAQTMLVESIGRYDLATTIGERGAVGRELQRRLAEKTAEWGVTLQSVEIRDVRLPAQLQDVLSRQAQAERERQARNTLGDAEVDIADKFAEASLAYKGDPVALHLRAMNMLFEAIKEKGRMVVVPTGRWGGRRRRR